MKHFKAKTPFSWRSLGMGLLLGFIVATAVQEFFTLYKLQFPLSIKFRPVVVKREAVPTPSIKHTTPTPKAVRKPTKQAKTSIVKTTLASFPKYLSDIGARTRSKVIVLASKQYKGNDLIALDNIIKSESGYDPTEINGIGACGMGQALPCSKMNCALTEEGAECQYDWIIQYIKNRYGTPSVAWSFHLQNNYY